MQITLAETRGAPGRDTEVIESKNDDDAREGHHQGGGRPRINVSEASVSCDSFKTKQKKKKKRLKKA